MRIHHLNCGSLCPLGGGLMDGGQGWLRRALLVCHCLLIETNEGLVLVDTGLGSKDVAHAHAHPRLSRVLTSMLLPRFDPAETALRQIEKLGYTASDVRHIVITHLDFDHAGGIEDFPHARVHVYAEELNAANHPDSWLARRRYRAQQWDRSVQWKTYVAHGEPWKGFRCVRDLEGLPPDILMVPLVGHTWGHCGVAVRGEHGWVLLAGDAYFHRGEMPRGPNERAHCTPGLRFYQTFMEVDRRSRLLNQQRLRELARDHRDVQIMCSHDAAELADVQAHAQPHRHAAARAPYRHDDGPRQTIPQGRHTTYRRHPS